MNSIIAFHILLVFTVFIHISKGFGPEDLYPTTPSSGSADSPNEKEAGCGTKAIDPTQTIRIQTPYYQYGYYPKNTECSWKFLGTSGCQPIINCGDTFDLAATKDCSGDYLQLSDGSDAHQKYCGKTGPNNVSSTSTILLATFHSGIHFGQEKGFKCLVSCAPNNNGGDYGGASLPHQDPKSTNCKCGVTGKEKSRIVGGTDAPVNKWKWQAALLLRNRNGPFCGGSLINDRFILTAAHCVVTTGIAALPAAMEVELNEYDITSKEDNTIKRNVVSIVPHPLYSPSTQDYDVAVLEMASPVNITTTEEPTLTPVCLPQRGDQNTYAGDIATVTGWGTTMEDGDQAAKLQQVDVPVITNEVCNQQYEDTTAITQRMICAGYTEGGKDSCQGDSGGPLVFLNGNGRYSEIGVVSFGKGCARPEKSGVYSRVTDLNDWIRMTARSGTWCEEL